MSELKILGGQLRSYKGWLTQSINNCFELIKVPSSAFNASSMVSRLEAALGELDERRHKVESCLESMEALDFGKDDDEDKKDREKYYAAQRLQVAQKCQNAISEVYLVYTRWNTQPEESGSTSPAQVVAAGQLGGQVRKWETGRSGRAARRPTWRMGPGTIGPPARQLAWAQLPCALRRRGDP